MAHPSTTAAQARACPPLGGGSSDARCATTTGVLGDGRRRHGAVRSARGRRGRSTRCGYPNPDTQAARMFIHGFGLHPEWRDRHRRIDRPLGGPSPLARALRPVRGRADDRARCHDRQRRAALDPGGPRLLAVRPRLGGERVPDPLRRAAAARRPRRRPDRPAACVPDRPRGVHRRVAALRPRSEPGHADRGALHPGRRGRARLRGDPRHGRDDVPRAARAGEGDRHLHLRRRRGRLDRVARRRRAHRGDQLALDLLRQPPDRTRDRVLRAAAGRGPRGRRASSRAPTLSARCW